MKKTLSKLVETVKTNKRHCVIATLSVFALVLSLSLAACRSDNRPETPSAPPDASSSLGDVTTTTTTQPEADGESASTTATTTEKDDVEVTKATSTTTEKPKVTSVSKTSTTSKNPTTTTSKVSTTSTKPVAVQTADPNTGVSWDGKSPIVYTYKDGTTGTEPQQGAKYEIEPGIKAVYIAPTAVYSEDCSKCGKEKGDGKNNTCVRWLMGDVDCPNCGEHVEAYTCHTCK